jgi:hypothetical protein
MIRIYAFRDEYVRCCVLGHKIYVMVEDNRGIDVYNIMTNKYTLEVR